MDSEKKQPKKKNTNLAWISITVLLSLLIIYTVYHVFANVGGVKTTPTGYAEHTSSTVIDGIVFRNEKALNSSYTGDIRYLVSDGERISNDAKIAEAYSNRSGEDLSAKIRELEEQLEIFQKSNDVGIISVTDIEKLNAQTEKLYSELMLAMSQNELAGVAEIEKELLICLNKKKIYDGTVSSYNAEISALETEINKLYASFGGDKETLTSSEGGYFYYNCDGYESILTLDTLSNLDLGELQDKINEVRSVPVKENDAVGKIVYDYTWYTACVCDASVASLLCEGELYEMTLFERKNTEVEMTLEKIGESDGEQTMLIFSCSVMPEGFSFGRYQTFEIKINSVKGYRVPSNAIYRITDSESGEEKVGVYILNASVVHFRRVEIIVECDGYYIVAECDRSLDNYKEFLDLNDLIIISGKDLYDGKIIDK